MKQLDGRCCRAASVALAVLVTNGFTSTGSAGVLDRISQEKEIRVAYREDAPPFSSKNKIGEPVGFMIDLCREVAKKLADQLRLNSLNVAYVPVTAADRFEAIQQNKADLLCEPTSATLARRDVVDFSIPTFVDGASLMIRADGPHDLKAMAGKKIGVLGGTTTEQSLRSTLETAKIAGDIIPAKTHAEGVAMLEEGKISAYFADRSILVSLIADSKAPGKLMLAENYLSVEPYALALLRGDEDFRLAVDRALSHIYRSGEIAAVFKRTFGDTKPGNVLQTLYLIAGLPD
ncbi:MAG: amino acid ABC transporter substrate-binding protein [Alphaproteobacteria bacterium]|nr:amino acid ABC transporter substrate-binding protein [Alphaproteobacteria bacterium]MBV9373624.1 amino acid ABC transporter substrate-binding protein [Alphaproteobacteria bacterium]